MARCSRGSCGARGSRGSCGSCGSRRAGGAIDAIQIDREDVVVRCPRSCCVDVLDIRDHHDTRRPIVRSHPAFEAVIRIRGVHDDHGVAWKICELRSNRERDGAPLDRQECDGGRGLRGVLICMSRHACYTRGSCGSCGSCDASLTRGSRGSRGSRRTCGARLARLARGARGSCGSCGACGARGSRLARGARSA